jgi:Uma2 family endonuclease
MAVEIQRVTADEFEKISGLPENADKRLELINGEIVEVVSNQGSSRLGMKIGSRLQQFLDQHEIGYLTGADGGYHVGADRFIPDAGYISKIRQPIASDDTYNPLAPDLAVEVVSPSDDWKDLLNKVTAYLAAGTIVWVVLPDEKEIRVYAPGASVRKFDIDSTLDGGDLLPGFTLHVKDLFPD